MKKKIILSIIVIILLIVIGFIIYENTSFLDETNNINIIQYEPGTLNELKNINIDDEKEIRKVSKYIKQLSGNEMVELALLKEIYIKYNSYITIGIQLEEENYCYYTNTKENISSISRMPKGLYEWVKEKIK